MARSYIKIYGPPISKAIKALEKIAVEMSEKTTIRFYDILMPPTPPRISEDEFRDLVLPDLELSSEEKVKLISGASQTLGEYDFFFEWGAEPTREQVMELVDKIDEALGKCGCYYTITTK